ncbi:MAG: hypothetical protein WB760_00655 [Xanthobacteraceae bacterium]
MRGGQKLPAVLLSTVALALAALGWGFCERLFKPQSALADDPPNSHAGAKSVPQRSLRLAQAVSQSTMKPEPPDKAAQRDSRQDRTSLTAYAKFENACIDVADGYEKLPGQGEKLFPVFKTYQGACGAGKNSKPLVFGVTHENDHNNHNGAANYNQNVSSYMGDFDPKTDLGQWLDLQLVSKSTPPSVKLKLDTADFQKTNVTGWPIQFGHMFIGLNDGTVATSLDKPVYVEFEIKIETKPVSQRAGYSGRRVILGALASWDEAPPRTNRQHFLEVDLVQSEGYSASYNEQLKPLCRDVPYDRCFYSNGPYAEGREIRYETVLREPHVPDTTKGWVRIRIPLSDLFRRLKWVSPPSDWTKAQLTGLYIGVESTGETATQIEVQNYEVYR